MSSLDKDKTSFLATVQGVELNQNQTCTDT